MKKTTLIAAMVLGFIVTSATISAYAQPRAAGLRLGATGIETAYQHSIEKNQFVESNLGLDFGYSANGAPGIKATGIYNFIWARPAWTDMGSWAIYAGPGVSLGYVNDEVHFMVGHEVVHYMDNGFMMGVCGQVGVEYNFWFPLQLSLDLRPTIGMHINGNNTRIGFYDNGLLGFSPTISVRYKF